MEKTKYLELAEHRLESVADFLSGALFKIKKLTLGKPPMVDVNYAPTYTALPPGRPRSVSHLAELTDNMVNRPAL
jgi:hypothetical protein